MIAAPPPPAAAEAGALTLASEWANEARFSFGAPRSPPTSLIAAH